MPCSNKHNLHLKNIVSSNNKSKKNFQVQGTKYDKLSLQVQCPVQSNLQLYLSCFLLMLAIN